MKIKTAINLVLGLTALTITTPAFSLSESCMRQVSMHFTTENWVNSQTSLVSIALSASVPADQVDKLTETIKNKLTMASKEKNWRLVNLTRNESDSGLMAITGQAIARLNNNELSTLQAKLKTLNKPGEKYSIDNIDYQPDLHTINQAKKALRADLYQQIMTGLQELNIALPDTHPSYQIYKINFNDAQIQEPVAYVASKVRTTQKSNLLKNTTLSGKMHMSAYVTYSAEISPCHIDKNESSST